MNGRLAAKRAPENDRRVSILFVLFLVIAIIAGLRLFVLQTLEYQRYHDLAFSQRDVMRTITPKRGRILTVDRGGSYYPLAMNERVFVIYAVPSAVEQPAEVARLLAPLLRDEVKVSKEPEEGEEVESEEIKSAEELEKEMEDRIYQKIVKDTRDPYEPLKNKVPEEIQKKVEALKLKGVGWEETWQRAYPEQALAAQTIGYVGYDAEGTYSGITGVERSYNDVLRGTPGSLELEVGATGGWIPLGLRNEFPAINGSDVVLTIDRAVQAKAEQLISANMEKWKADSGTVAVMEPSTGRMLAIANAPTFDLNKYGDVEDPKVYANDAVTERYEPGSIFKPFPVAAGVDLGMITPDETFDDPGTISVGNYEIRNSDDQGHGRVSVTVGIEKSLNVVLVQIAQKIGLSNIYPYYVKFGLKDKSGIDLPSEPNARLDVESNWYEIDLATSSFGQGKIVLSTLQILKAYTAFINDGKMVKPRVVEQIINHEGTVEKFDTEYVGQPISSRAAATTTGILVSSAKNGYAKAGTIPGYTFAAKTGTAQMPNKNGDPGYSNEKITSYVGYFPVEDPKFLILVKFNAPKGSEQGTWGETVSAPIFKEMAQFLVTYYQIPPRE